MRHDQSPPASKRPHFHQGHRSRVRQDFLRQGLDGFYDHQALELLLFFGILRRDVNHTAHEMIDRFGSLRGVLEANGEELMQCPFVKHRAAALIKLVLPLSQKYEASRKAARPVIHGASEAMAYLEPLFAGCKSETVYGLFLDAAQRILSCLQLNENGERFSDLSARHIAAVAVDEGAAMVILAQSRPGGTHMPGPEDIASQERLSIALAVMQLRLADHLIHTRDCFVSLAEMGLLKGG